MIEKHSVVRHVLKRWSLVLVGLLFMLAGAARAESVRLNAVPSGSLGLWSSVLVEEGGELSLAQVQARQQAGAFLPGHRPVLAFGIGPRPVWVRLELNNPTAQALSFRLALGTTWIDRLDAHLVHAGQVTSWRTGDSQPHAPGLVPAAGFVFTPAFQPGISELYLRVQTDDPLVLPIELLDAQGAAVSERVAHYSYGFLYGFLLALAIYNGVLYAGLRERSYFYYALYLFSFIFANISYTGHGVAWSWPAQPGFQRYVILASMVLFGCCGLLFASRFLALAEHAPWAFRWVKALIWAGLSLLGLSLALDSQRGAALLAFNFVTLFTVTMVVLGVMTARLGRTAGRYFLIASVAGMLGAATTALAVWGWLPFSQWTYRGAEIGILLEATLFSLALAARMRQQEIARQSAESLARLDSLTGLRNRRSFLESAEAIWSTAERNGRPLSLVIMDIDYFKRINDRYGHESGDRVLVDIAGLLPQSCRAGDILARWGGEEFVLLLPETDIEQACQLAERIRQSIAGRRLTVKNRLIAYTASFGVAERGDKANLDHLLGEADERLYTAKSKGRNRVVGAPVSAQA